VQKLSKTELTWYLPLYMAAYYSFRQKFQEKFPVTACQIFLSASLFQEFFIDFSELDFISEQIQIYIKSFHTKTYIVSHTITSIHLYTR